MDGAILAVVGDLHCNSTVALGRPIFLLDEEGQYRAGPPQRWIWKHWLDYWQEVATAKERTGFPVVAILNGELADDNYHATTQLVTRNNADQIRHSVSVLEPCMAVADYIIVTRGTEAHSKQNATMDELIAEDIGAVEDKHGHRAMWAFNGEIAGLNVLATHHPQGGGGGRSWTKDNAANMLAADIMLAYAERGEPAPDLVLTGHIHKPMDSYDTHRTRVIGLPSWQLCTSYGYRIGGGVKPFLPIGGAYIVIQDGHYEVTKCYKDWPMKSERLTWKDLQKQT
jgi:hypothetical protein